MRIEDGILRSKKFCIKQLKEWYKRAEEDGFDDIELFDPNNMEPKLHLSQKNTVKSEGLFEDSERHGIVVDPEGKIEYYQAALDLNHIILSDGYHVFDSYEDQQVWDMHSQGMSQEAIAKKVQRTQQGVSKKILKYTSLLTNKLSLPSAQKVDSGCVFPFSEDAEYEVVDYCKDALKTTEDVMISKIDRDREGIRTREFGYFENLEEDLRNRFTGIRSIEKLELLDAGKKIILSRAKESDKKRVSVNN